MSGVGFARGDLPGAEPLLRRAVAKAERVLGPEHPDTELFRDNLRLLLEARAAAEGGEAEQDDSPPPKGG